MSQRHHRQNLVRQTAQRGLQTGVTLAATDGRQRRLELPCSNVQKQSRFMDISYIHL